MARIGFVGLGRMGSGMAARLVAAGHEVAVFNRTADKTRQLVAAGARAATSAGDAAAGADAVFVMVADDTASRAVWLGDDGILAAGLREGALAVECSTVSYDWVMDLAAAAQARGLRFLDSPVTGLPAAAAAGELTLLMGAAPGDVVAAEPLLQAVATSWIRFGPPGAGTAYKLIVNLMGAVQIAGVAEGLVLAERAGLDLEQVLAAIATGQAASPQVVRNGRRMVAADHDRDIVFSARLRRKDAAYGIRLADRVGVTAPLGRVALDGLDRLLAAGLGDHNESSIITVMREQPD
jgi:3-hydroxyisobutyrate dehydrogenase